MTTMEPTDRFREVPVSSVVENASAAATSPTAA
jgi:hypothetical protein